MSDRIKRNISRIIAWFFSVFFLLGGITYITDHIPSCILLILAGMLCLPPFVDLLKRKNIYCPLWLRIILIIILYAITSHISPKIYM